MFKDKHRYREFLQSKEKIATNILADRLNKLEVNGFITKSVDPDNLKSAIYNLTMKGIELLPTMVEIIKWSAMNDESSALNNNLIAYKGRGTASVIQDIRDKLEDQLVSTWYFDLSAIK